MIQETAISTEELELIQTSGYFDANYYIANYEKELDKDEEPLEHFLHKGWQEGKNPSEKFNVSDYLKMYPEVKEKGVNPLLHYLHEGKNKGYFPNRFADQLAFVRQTGEFDGEYYLEHNKEVIPEGEDPLQHFMRIGWKEGRNPNINFDFNYYLSYYQDVRTSDLNPFFHYVRFGKPEGRFSNQLAEDVAFVRASGLFDVAYYKQKAKTIVEDEDPIAHFLCVGWHKYLSPSADFNTKDYLAIYGAEVGDTNPLLHYLRVGKGKGHFIGRPLEQLEFVREAGAFNEAYYLQHNSEVIPEGEAAIHHFMRVGYKKGCNPNTDFDVEYYINTYEDVRTGGSNPFFHYLSFGKFEGRFQNLLEEEKMLVHQSGIFDAKYYKEQNPEAPFNAGDTLDYFMRFGWKKGHDPSRYFDTKFYLDNYIEVKSKKINPVVHYLKLGLEQRYIPSLKFSSMRLPEDFNVEQYLKLNPDIDSGGKFMHYKAMWHYLKLGKNKGNPYYFDAEFYKSFYLDVSKSQGELQVLNHWLKSKGRYANLNDYLQTLRIDAKLFTTELTELKLQQLNPDMSIGKPMVALTSVLRQAPPILLRFFDDAEDNYHLYFQVALNFEKQFAQSLEKKKNLKKKLKKKMQENLDKQAQKNLDKAEDTYHLALMFKATSLCYGHLGNIALHKGKQQQAIEYYYEAIHCKAKSQWLYTNLADTLISVNRPAEAISVINDAINYFSPNPNLIQFLEKSITSYWEQEEERFLSIAKRPNRQDSIKAMTVAIQTVVKAYRKRFMSSTKSRAHINLNKENILIIGDYNIPQCVRYRIEQKREQLEQAGFKVTTLPWTKSEDMQKELLWHDIIIFYRVPATPSVIQVIEQAGALGKLRFYEIDDLLFEPVYPPDINSYGGYVTPKQYLNLIKGMVLMREAACLCDYAIGSTKSLLKYLEPLVLQKKGFLHRNALDSLNVISEPNFADKDPLAPLTIFYGSGTLAHNSDFILEALPAIERILAKYSHVHFVVAGHLKLPEQFLMKYQERVSRMPLSDLNVYWSYLARADINLAVLHLDTINDCKSELKWFEAACFGIPSVVSCTQNYLDVIQEGKDGFVVSGVEQWYNSLDLLVNDADLRKNIGLIAQARVKEDYSLSKMAKNIGWIIEQALEDFQSTSNSKQMSSKELVV